LTENSIIGAIIKVPWESKLDTEFRLDSSHVLMGGRRFICI